MLLTIAGGYEDTYCLFTDLFLHLYGKSAFIECNEVNLNVDIHH